MTALRPSRDDAPEAGGLREAYARIIDPHGWATRDHQYSRLAEIERLSPEDVESAKAGAEYYVRNSLAKADAILALSAHPVHAEPVAWQRFHPTHGWRDMDAEDVEHYRAQGQRIRALGVIEHPASGEDVEGLREKVAQWLCEEVEWPNPIVGAVWPLHDDDDGYRGGGAYARLQPKDVVERFRDIAERLLAALSTRRKS